MAATQVRSRQEPGSACEECRRRKLRCDRREPRCGLCEESGEECVFVKSHKRGPKRGHMKLLLDRLSALEQRLANSSQSASPDPSIAQADNNTEASAKPDQPEIKTTTAPSAQINLISATSIENSTGIRPLDHCSPEGFNSWIWHGLENFDPVADIHVGTISPRQSSSHLHEDGSGHAHSHGNVSGMDFGELDGMDHVMAGRQQSLLTPSDLDAVNAGSDIDIDTDIHNMPVSVPSRCMDANDHNLLPRVDSATAVLSLLPDLQHSDRDQAYFERVHACIPIVHEQSYYSWSTDAVKSEPQICLQLTMWALANSASAQLPTIGLALYHDARRRLGELDAAGRGHEMMDATLAQAWLLLAIFEFVRVDYRRGWMSAGRAFRLIQLMRLHEEDRCIDAGLPTDPRVWVRKEERRRTFWVAYALDRFVGVSDGSPSTFSEDADVRLPAPERDFQNGQPIEMPYLCDALLAGDRPGTNSLLEFVITATICGRVNAHRAHIHTSRLHTHDPLQAFWSRHQSIHSILTLQLQTLTSSPLSHSQSLSASSGSVYPIGGAAMRHLDPLMLFTHVMAQTMAIYMYRLMAECANSKDTAHQSLSDGCARAFAAAVSEMSAISTTLWQMSCFKAHPFCPIALHICLDSLMAFEKNGGGFADHLRLASNALKNLRRVNIFGEPSADAFGESVLSSTQGIAISQM